MDELADIIRQEIKAAGVISFARYMDLALYFPCLGYYERPVKQIGCQGDFYTSVSTGSLFGELLAFQFAEWIRRLEASDPIPAPARDGGQVSPDSKTKRRLAHSRFQIAEAGAHDGRLASDILSWLRGH